MNADFSLDGLTLETDRLILRPFRESDLNDLYEYASVDGVGEKAGWHHHEDIEESRRILSEFIRDDRTFAVTLRSTGKVIGSLGIEKYGAEDRLTEFNGLKGRELGFVLSRDFWGKGLMPEAVKKVIEYLFDEMDFDFLTCCHFIENEQSGRVQEKCGFRPYRRLKVETEMGTTEESLVNLLLNPSKDIRLIFSHPETLIYKE